MSLSPQTDHSLRSLAILGLRHLRRFQIFDHEPRQISNDVLEEIGRRAVAAIEDYLAQNPQPNARASLGRRGQSVDGFATPAREAGFDEKSSPKISVEEK
jgi:hypothetical protein